MPAPGDLARLAAVAAHGRGDSRSRAALELTRRSADPAAFQWWWLWLASAPPETAAPLVESLPRGLVLLPRGVPAAVDTMTAHDDATCSAWVDVRVAVLRALDPADPGSSDLATLMACCPGTHPDVLAAALALLAGAGHPSRGALLRAAEAELRRAAPAVSGRAERPDADAVVMAATILAELAPAADDHQRQLAARCSDLVRECSAPDVHGRSDLLWSRHSDWASAVLARLCA